MDSYAKVIKQVLVFAIQESGEEIDGWPNLLFFSPPQPSAHPLLLLPHTELLPAARIKRKKGVPQCPVCSSYLSILPIRIPPRFPLKMQTPALPSRRGGTDTTAAVDIVLYNAAVLS